jgi:hypothetical protein
MSNHPSALNDCQGKPQRSERKSRFCLSENRGPIRLRKGFGQPQEGTCVGAKVGTKKKPPIADSPQVIGAKGGTRTPTVLPARS